MGYEARQLDLIDPSSITADDDVAADQSSLFGNPQTVTSAAREGDLRNQGNNDPEKENPLNRRSQVRATPIKRAISAVRSAGLSVTKVEVAPDGTFCLSTVGTEQTASTTNDIFARWEGRL